MKELLGQIKTAAYNDELEKIARDPEGLVRVANNRTELVERFVDTNDTANREKVHGSKSQLRDTVLFGPFGALWQVLKTERIDTKYLQNAGFTVKSFNKIYTTPDFATKNNLRTR